MVLPSAPWGQHSVIPPQCMVRETVHITDWGLFLLPRPRCQVIHISVEHYSPSSSTQVLLLHFLDGEARPSQFAACPAPCEGLCSMGCGLGSGCTPASRVICILRGQTVPYRLPQIGISVQWAAMGLISGRWPTAVVAIAYQLLHRPCLSPTGEAAGEAPGALISRAAQACDGVVGLRLEGSAQSGDRPSGHFCLVGCL